MKKILNWSLFTAVAFVVVVASSLCAVAEDVVVDGKAFRKISIEEYRDKMKGGWIGQIAGVCWGAPTEFRYCG